MLRRGRPPCFVRSPASRPPRRIASWWCVACNSIPPKISRDSTENSAECERRQPASTAPGLYPMEHPPPKRQRLRRKTGTKHDASTWLGPTLILIGLDALMPQTVVENSAKPRFEACSGSLSRRRCRFNALLLHSPAAPTCRPPARIRSEYL